MNGPGCTSLYGTCLNQSTNWGFSAEAFIYGISIGTGSGWTGNFTGFADDVRIGFADLPQAQYDFEVSAAAVPEPTSLSLLVLGIAGLGVAAGRRRFL